MHTDNSVSNYVGNMTRWPSGQQVNDLKKLHFIALELQNRGISIRSVQVQLLKTLAVVE